MSNKPAQIILIDKETGEKVEEVDARTRADLVKYDDNTTAMDKFNEIDNEINALKNPYKAPSVTVNEYNCSIEIGDGDYTVTFDIIKGTANVSDIILYDNEIEKRISEINIEALNLNGSIGISCTIDSSISTHHVIKLEVLDDQGESASDTAIVEFVYPVYYTDISGDQEEIDIEGLIASSTKIVAYSKMSTIISGKELKSRRLIFMSPDEITKIIDQHAFDVTNTFNHDIQLIHCKDGSMKAYHIYTSNILNYPRPYKYNFMY